MKRFAKLLISLILILSMSLCMTSCDVLIDILNTIIEPDGPEYAVDLSDIPEFNGYPYVIVNNGVPFFTNEDMTSIAYEEYANLDRLGRCGPAMACIGLEIMPTGERESIGSVKPTGWVTMKYDCVDGKYLYNRCHLIGFQLTGENANELNLITGTRFMNVEGMLPFENLVADYIEETRNHVIYRVTPIFSGANLVASGVLMEAKSVEDNEIEFCVYVYNNQPNIRINYADGSSKIDDGIPFPEGDILLPDGSDVDNTDETITEDKQNYVINLNTDKFHLPTCTYANSEKYDVDPYYATKSELEEYGFEPCKICKP